MARRKKYVFTKARRAALKKAQNARRRIPGGKKPKGRHRKVGRPKKRKR